MAKTTKVKKQKKVKPHHSSNLNPNPPDKMLKKKKKKLINQKSESKSKSKVKSPSSSSSDSESESEKVQKLLEPFSKDQLIDLLTDAALSSSTFFAKICEFADKDVSHRKIFIHGLSWDTTNETLISAFQNFGEIESSNVVLDKATGKAKGYAFVTFKTRKSALKALKQPNMVLNNRLVVWQLASLGPPSTSGQLEGNGNLSGRKIYVSNVQSDVSAERLRAFFAKFGEIESGPMGFDVQTGKFKGYALFVYRNVEGAKNALEEPYKVFEGRELHCQKAAEGKKIHGGAAGITTGYQPIPPMYAAMGPQNMALLGQSPNVNVDLGLLSAYPLYNSLLANPSPATSGLMNASPIAVLGQGGIGMGMGMGMGVGGYNGVMGNYGFDSLGSGGSTTTNLGAYGGASAGSSGPMIQGMHYAYPNTPIGQKSSAPPASGT
ncbi:UBP1-associated protein 2B-like [Coffea arabica]|uniref:UBP1-associated protein 2B-like n=1 Tax=Coffea arabica TaxID=13443 RepID=A0A6P6TEV6_COFAR|nr:UBP1-associated protein 2B-like [Coffea arabica]